jgi:tetratricopeptide (TPR) repeat protein
MSLFNGIATSKRQQIDEWINMGISLFDEERFEEAIKYYDKVLAFELSCIALNNKGNALRRLGRFDESLCCFEEALKLNTEHSAPWHGKANVLVDLGKIDDTLFFYDKALKAHPEDSVKGMILSEKGSLLVSLGREREADECFRLALALDPQNYMVLANIAFVYLLSGKTDNFAEYIKRAIEVVPEYERPRKIKEIQDKIEMCKQKVEIKNETIREKENISAGAWNFKGESFLEAGKINDALKCFDEALKINPKLGKAWINKGEVLHKMGKFDEALKCEEVVLKLDPDNSTIWYNKGTTLACLKRYEEAIEWYEKVLQIDPECAVAWTGKGLSLGCLLKCDEAIQCFDKALEIDPTVKHAKETRELIKRSIKK